MNIEDLPSEMLYEIFSHLPLTDVDKCRKVNERWDEIADLIIQKWFDISHLGTKYRGRTTPKITYGNNDSADNFNSYEDIIEELYKFSGDAVHDFQHKILIAETKGIKVSDYFYEDHGEYDNAMCKNGSYKINMAKEITLDNGSRAVYVAGVSNNPAYYSFIHRPIWGYPGRNYDKLAEFCRSTSEIYEKPNEEIRAQYSNNTRDDNEPDCNPNESKCDPNNINNKLDGELTRMMEIALFSDISPWDLN